MSAGMAFKAMAPQTVMAVKLAMMETKSAGMAAPRTARQLR